ncbi:MAG: tyrosine-type recombinase/integrase [Candidatus Micrarchaeaceae archaeon]
MAYQEDEGTLKSVQDKVLGDPLLSKKNVQHIENHVAYLQSKGSNIRTVIKHLYHIRRFYRLVKNSKTDFKDLTRADIQYAMAKLETSDYSVETKRNVKAVIKSFWKQLKGDGEFYPPEIRWIKTSQSRKETKLPSDLLTEDEIKAMIDAATTLRNKAFIALLYDSGGRIGEMLNMTKKSVNLESYPMHVLLDGKTGPRQIPIMFSGPYIGAYMNSIKGKAIDDSLWTTYNRYRQETHRRADYATLAKMLKQTAAAAGVTKRVHPHLFRHSRATNYANKMTEQRLKYYFGWTGDSKMASVYVHMSGRDIDNAVLEANGIKPPESQTETKLKSRVCPTCQTQNMATNDYCGHCSSPLDITVIEMLKRNQALAIGSATKPEFTDEFIENWIREKYLNKKRNKRIREGITLKGS